MDSELNGYQAGVVARVERTAGGNLTISWQPSLRLPISVYWSQDPDHFDRHNKPLAVIKNGRQALIPDPEPKRRPYFVLVPAMGDPLTAAERQLLLTGESNFRDMGGYINRHGRSVKWGQLYRSGELGRLDDDDLAYLAGLGLRRVFDLREPYEIGQLPDRLPPKVEADMLPVDGGDIPMPDLYQALRSGDLSVLDEDHLVRSYRAYVRRHTDSYGTLIRQITADENRPALIHCTAGKDRSGLAAAIILWILEVPMETVMADYLLSNHYRARLVERILSKTVETVTESQGLPAEAINTAPLEALLTARPAYLSAAVETIEEMYGSIDTYIVEGLSMSPVERRRFQDKMLT